MTMLCRFSNFKLSTLSFIPLILELYFVWVIISLIVGEIPEDILMDSQPCIDHLTSFLLKYVTFLECCEELILMKGPRYNPSTLKEQ